MSSSSTAMCLVERYGRLLPAEQLAEQRGLTGFVTVARKIRIGIATQIIAQAAVDAQAEATAMVVASVVQTFP